MTRGKIGFGKRLGLLFICGLFIFFLGSFNDFQAQAQVGDAIAVRVLPNPEHYSPATWYAKQGFKGSPVAMKVDGYEAVRDGRTVYVNVANVVGDVVVSDNKLWTNIYLISYNQEATPETLSIFDKILSKWRFNSNLITPGNCFDQASSTSCLSDTDCTGGGYCNSQKARLVRDIKRLGDIVDLRMKVEEYGNKYGKYPVLSAGTYLPGVSISTWPSWSAELGNALGTAPVDPINKLGKCITYDEEINKTYDPVTCWNDSSKSFADAQLRDPALNLPIDSRAMVYSSANNGATYEACAYMESGILVDSTYGACKGSENINKAPTVDCGSLLAIAGQPFEGYIKASDDDDTKVILDITSVPSSFSVADGPTSASQKIYSSSAPTPTSGGYVFSGTASDAHSNSTSFSCTVTTQTKAFIVYPIPNQRIITGKALNLSIYANHSEKDYDGLRFNFSDQRFSCSNVQLIPDGRYKCDLSVTFRAKEGPFQVSVNVSNSTGDSSPTQNFTVEAYNNPPVMNPLKCDTMVRVSSYSTGGAPGHYNYSCKFSAVDPDGHKITDYYVSGLNSRFDYPANLILTTNSDGTGSLDGFASAISVAGNYKIAILAVDEFGAISKEPVVLPLKIADFCGDEKKQTPNMEGLFGPRGDGYEDCDDHDGLPSFSESNISWQYGCNSSTCASLRDGYCGDETAQDGRTSLLGAVEDLTINGEDRIYKHYKENYGEKCDDGNSIDGDGCNTYKNGLTSCQWACGDGTVNDGLRNAFTRGIEKVDYILLKDTEYYHSIDVGNNSAGQPEECDDGNNIDGDGCNTFTNSCRFVCGDGRLNTDKGEQCEVERSGAATAENLDQKTCQNFYGPISIPYKSTVIQRPWEGGSLQCTAASCMFNTDQCVYYDDVSGHINQALNGSSASGVTVSITYNGIVYSAVSDADGFFTIEDVPHRAPTTHRITTSGGNCASADRTNSGSVTCRGTGETRVMNGPITYVAGEASSIEFYVFPSDWSAQYAFVLSWSGPTDLDAHLVYGSNHVSYQGRTAPGSSLDYDDLSANGHEVVSIASWELGQAYRLYVHNYGRKKGGANFNDQVNIKLFSANGGGTYLLNQYNYGCNNTQEYWEALSFVTSNGSIQPVTPIGSCGNGSTVSVSGTVTNALTGEVISGAKAVIEYGDKEGKFYEAYSDASGAFVISNIPNRDLMNPVKKMTISATGFKDTFENLSLSATSPSKAYYIFPSDWKGQFAIVLNWDAPPLDLDAFLKLNNCTVYWGNKGTMCNGLMLDRDDQNELNPNIIPPDNNLTKGQETISMYSSYFAGGGETFNLYDYYVYNYSGGSFPASARVRLFFLNNLGQAELLRECKATSHTERYWSVFKFYAPFSEPSNSFYELTGRNSITCKDVYSTTIPPYTP